LVHRDVKPSNLLVTKNGVVKILDLGLARLAGAIPKDLDAAPTGSDLSGLAGTPDYMAPETAQDSRCADIRSDLYSLGCTFYFLLTSQAPFPGGGWPEKLLRHQLDSAPSAVVIRPDVPDEIAGVLQRLMAKDPAERYGTPAELAVDLERWLAAHTVSADPVPALLATTNGTSAPTVSLNQKTPNVMATSERDSATPAPASMPSILVLFPHRWSGLSWPLGLVAASIVGLAAALLLRGSAGGLRKANDRQAGPVETSGIAREGSVRFVTEGSSEGYATLASAVAAAPDDAVIVIEGDGPVHLGPQRLHGKALTLRAGGGSRPRLRFVPTTSGQPWEPLLASNRPLRLEGLELSHESDTRASAPETAHLVYVEKAALVMVNCVVDAPRSIASVVCRDCHEVRLDDCRLKAAALALCVETGESGTNVRLHDTRIQVEAADGAAVSTWASGNGRDGSVRLDLDDCTILGGRAIAFGTLPRHVEVNARHDHFAFRNSLVSFASSGEAREWRRVTTWQEEDNTYEAGGAGWLRVNGVSTGVADLSAWRELWNTPPDSVQRDSNR
ncbi:MAG TPA: serine/threonine-protein kinase, partial [Gemmataceae bacterium]|nr:serine/threonine-protein kinase [Gemmataceae bacterium]